MNLTTDKNTETTLPCVPFCGKQNTRRAEQNGKTVKIWEKHVTKKKKRQHRAMGFTEALSTIVLPPFTTPQTSLPTNTSFRSELVTSKLGGQRLMPKGLSSKRTKYWKQQNFLKNKEKENVQHPNVLLKNFQNNRNRSVTLHCVFEQLWVLGKRKWWCAAVIENLNWVWN